MRNAIPLNICISTSVSSFERHLETLHFAAAFQSPSYATSHCPPAPLILSIWWTFCTNAVYARMIDKCHVKQKIMFRRLTKALEGCVERPSARESLSAVSSEQLRCLKRSRTASAEYSLQPARNTAREWT